MSSIPLFLDPSLGLNNVSYILNTPSVLLILKGDNYPDTGGLCLRSCAIVRGYFCRLITTALLMTFLPLLDVLLASLSGQPETLR